MRGSISEYARVRTSATGSFDRSSASSGSSPVLSTDDDPAADDPAAARLRESRQGWLNRGGSSRTGVKHGLEAVFALTPLVIILPICAHFVACDTADDGLVESDRAAHNPESEPLVVLARLTMPLHYTAFLVHAICGSLRDTQTSAASLDYRRSGYYHWFGRKCSLRLCCFQPAQKLSEQEYERSQAALPTWFLALHLLLLWAAGCMTGGLLNSGSFVAASRTCGALTLSLRPLGYLIGLVVALFMVWAMVHMRIGALVVYGANDSLRSFQAWALRWFGLCMASQLYLLLKFVAWYFDSQPAVTAAVGMDGADYERVWAFQRDIILATYVIVRSVASRWCCSKYWPLVLVAACE